MLPLSFFFKPSHTPSPPPCHHCRSSCPPLLVTSPEKSHSSCYPTISSAILPFSPSPPLSHPYTESHAAIRTSQPNVSDALPIANRCRASMTAGVCYRVFPCATITGNCWSAAHYRLPLCLDLNVTTFATSYHHRRNSSDLANEKRERERDVQEARSISESVKRSRLTPHL